MSRPSAGSGKSATLVGQPLLKVLTAGCNRWKGGEQDLPLGTLARQLTWSVRRRGSAYGEYHSAREGLQAAFPDTSEDGEYARTAEAEDRAIRAIQRRGEPEHIERAYERYYSAIRACREADRHWAASVRAYLRVDYGKSNHHVITVGEKACAGRHPTAGSGQGGGGCNGTHPRASETQAETGPERRNKNGASEHRAGKDPTERCVSITD